MASLSTIASLRSDLENTVGAAQFALDNFNTAFPAPDVNPDTGVVWLAGSGPGAWMHANDYASFLNQYFSASSFDTGITKSDDGEAYTVSLSSGAEFKDIKAIEYLTSPIVATVEKNTGVCRVTEDGNGWANFSMPTNGSWHTLLPVPWLQRTLSLGQTGEVAACSDPRIPDWVLSPVTFQGGQGADHSENLGVVLGVSEFGSGNDKFLISEDLNAFTLIPILDASGNPVIHDWKTVTRDEANGVFILAAFDGTIATVRDPRVDPVSVITGAPAGQWHGSDVTDYGLTCVVGQGGKIAYSYDPENQWQEATNPGGDHQDIVWAQGQQKFSVCGLTGSYLYSPDDAAPPPPPPPPGGLIATSSLQSFGGALADANLINNGIEAETYPNVCRSNNQAVFWHGYVLGQDIEIIRCRCVAAIGRAFKETASGVVTFEIRGHSSIPATDQDGVLIGTVDGTNAPEAVFDETFTVPQTVNHVWITMVTPDASGNCNMAELQFFTNG